jgi:hypothetical protein
MSAPLAHRPACGTGARGQNKHEVHRDVISRPVLQQVREHFDAGLSATASRSQIPIADIERLVSAWSVSCKFVQSALDAFAPILRATFGEVSRMGADLAAPLDATVFVLSDTLPSGTHAHQDIAYKWNKPVDVRYAYTTWLALDSCAANTGALRFSGGMPSWPVLPRQDFLHADFCDPAQTEQWRSREVIACAEPGDVVVFDAVTWHACSPYTERGRRLALAIRWASRSGWERTLELPVPAPSVDEFGMDTAGSVLVRAIDRVCVSRPPSAPKRGGVRHQLQRLQSDGFGVAEQLSTGATRALVDLSMALQLLQEHGARPAGHVWAAVRERALPELNAIADRGAR